jgi:hypothetical protein
MMSLNLRLVTAVACLALLGQPFVHASPGRNNDKEENLAARIEHEQNPGKKARLQLRLAKLRLTEADEAYHSRNFAEGRDLLKQYLSQIRASWATLQGAENGVRKHLRAFKDLEIALREDDRFLQDMSRRIPYPESETIKAIAKESSAVHNQVLEAIFPVGVPPKARRKPPRAPESSKPPKAGAVKS